MLLFEENNVTGVPLDTLLLLLLFNAFGMTFF